MLVARKTDSQSGNPEDSSHLSQVAQRIPSKSLIIPRFPLILDELRKREIYVEKDEIILRSTVWRMKDAQENIRKISKVISIRRWNKMKEFNISYSSYNAKHSNDIEAFGARLKTFQCQIEQLSLGFTDETDHPTMKEASLLISVIARHFICLRSLDLRFTNYQALTLKEIRFIGSEISRNLNKLELLNLEFSGCYRIPNEGLQVFSSRIVKGLSQLRCLELCFRECSGLADQELAIFGGCLARYATHLKQLNLRFNKCNKITDPGVEAFTSVIAKNLRELGQLSLSFAGSSLITDHVIELLTPLIAKYLFKIPKLKLSFSNCAITDKGLQFLGSEAIRHLTQVQQLYLSFKKNSLITNKGLDFIGKNIANHLTQLKCLALNFSECAITDFGLKALAASIANMPQLSELTIKLVKCYAKELIMEENDPEDFRGIGRKNISDRGVDILESLITKHLTQLQRLYLNFRGMSLQVLHRFYPDDDTRYWNHYYNSLEQRLKSIPNLKIR